tara:strand:- start:496 stop:636 length:141 start_codon:yes stop_codon:yes gene_type:complete
VLIPAGPLITGNAATATATWAGVEHSGLDIAGNTLVTTGFDISEAG